MTDVTRLLPAMYCTTPQDAALQRALLSMAEVAQQDIDETFSQFFPSTASGWGLELWESAWGIPIDRKLDEQARRARICAKVRGSGATTVETIRAIVQRFTQLPVQIMEQAAQYQFVVWIIGPGIKNLPAMMDAVNEAKPAHLSYYVAFRFIPQRPVYVGLAPRRGEVCIVGPVECSGYLQSQVSVAAVARRGDVVRMAALACPQPTEPVYVGLAPRQGEVYIVGPVKCRGDVKSQVYVAAVGRRGDVVRMNALACPQPEDAGT